MRFVMLIFVILASHCLTAAQTTVDDFNRTRDITKDIEKGKSVFVFKKPTYSLKRIKKRAIPVAAKRDGPKADINSKKYDLPADTKSAVVWKRLGVTIWHQGKDSDESPKRVSAETTFVKGDKVRLSFESPTAGYLYVIDREVYADGTVGEPQLVFPTMLSRGGNNRIEAGQMVDVPAQSDRVSFFKLESKKENWRGELLTVIVSPEPLKDIEIPEESSPIAAALVEALEAKYLKSVNEYEQQGSQGKAYTKAEKEAGGSLTRELTQKDPFPQTMFRVRMRQREPLLVNFGLIVK